MTNMLKMLSGQMKKMLNWLLQECIGQTLVLTQPNIVPATGGVMEDYSFSNSLPTMPMTGVVPVLISIK